MANKIWFRRQLTGGLSAALDGLDVTLADGVGLTDGDFAFIGESTSLEGDIYVYDSTIGGTEDSPFLIKPDLDAGVAYTGNGRWKRQWCGYIPTSGIHPIGVALASGAATITVKQRVLEFRSTTVSDGSVNRRAVNSQLSLVIPLGATLGTIGAVESDIAIVAIDNSGTVELAVINIGNGVILDETEIIDTVAIDAASDTIGVFYSTTARTGVPYRIVGYIKSTQATAGTWAVTPTLVQGIGGTAEKKFSTIRGAKNLIINGNFDIWQRATSQTSSGYDSDDRWKNTNVGSTKTHSQQVFTLGQTDVPGNPEFYSETAVSSVAGASNFVQKNQRIEGVETFSGKTVTLSFWAKADASKNMAIDLDQSFGTGGSPSATVVAIGAQKVALTTSWQNFKLPIAIPSISGKTLGTDENDYLGVTFWFDAGSDFDSRTDTLGQQSGTFDIARVSIVEGSMNAEFEERTIGEELALCQRYYLNLDGVWTIYLYITTESDVVVDFPVQMRTAPVLISATRVSYTAYAQNLSRNSFRDRTTQIPDTQIRYLSNIKLDAEL